MPDAAAEHYAKEAQRLRHDETLIMALAKLSKDALDDLVVADAANPIQVIRAQQKAQVIDALLTELEAAVLALGTSGQQANS